MIIRVGHIATGGREVLGTCDQAAMAQELCKRLIKKKAVGVISWRPSDESAVQAIASIDIAVIDTLLFRLKKKNDERFFLFALRAGHLRIALVLVYSSISRTYFCH